MTCAGIPSDFYARVRSLWYQNRQSEIRNGEPGETPLPDFPDDFLEDLEDEGEVPENEPTNGEAPSPQS